MRRIRIFTDDEIIKLLKNPNILEIRNKSQLVYSNNFKIYAIREKLKHPEKTAREIFVNAGFDMNIINERTPQRRIKEWMNRYKKFGIEYFLEKNKYRYQTIKRFSPCEHKEDELYILLKKITYW